MQLIWSTCKRSVVVSGADPNLPIIPVAPNQYLSLCLMVCLGRSSFRTSSVVPMKALACSVAILLWWEFSGVLHCGEVVFLLVVDVLQDLALQYAWANACIPHCN